MIFCLRVNKPFQCHVLHVWCFAVCLKIYCISAWPSTNITAEDCNKPWVPRDTFKTASSELNNTYTWTYSMIEFIRIHQQQISAYHTPTESRVSPALEPDKIRPSPQETAVLPEICWSSRWRDVPSLTLPFTMSRFHISAGEKRDAFSLFCHRILTRVQQIWFKT